MDQLKCRWKFRFFFDILIMIFYQIVEITNALDHFFLVIIITLEEELLFKLNFKYYLKFISIDIFGLVTQLTVRLFNTSQYEYSTF